MKTEERRYILDPVEVEERGEGQTPLIRGYAIVFNQESGDLGGFRETIDSRALDGADMTDVVAVMEHMDHRLLGRSNSRAKTLQMEVDSRGLKVTIDPPTTGYGPQAIEQIKRGDIQGMSFRFTTKSDKWEKRDGKPFRTVMQIGKLIDVSLVAHPAYPQTDVAVRSLTEWEKAEEPKPTIQAPELDEVSYYRSINNIHRKQQ